MMKPAIAFLATTALAAPSVAAAAPQIDIAASGPVVELSVFESVQVAPDLATIGAGVSSDAPTASEALRQNSAEMQKVIARIKTLGIAEKDIQTTGINLNARYDYDQDTQKQVFRGYQAANRVSIILRKIDETGRVLDVLVAAGATDLSGPAFGIDDVQPAVDTARTRAMARAAAQAKSYAAMLGYAGARVLSITESMSGSGPMPQMAKVQASADFATLPSVQPGMVSTGINVTVSYELVGQSAATAG